MNTTIPDWLITAATFVGNAALVVILTTMVVCTGCALLNVASDIREAWRKRP